MVEPRGTIVTQSFWRKGRVRYEQIELKDYPAWISRDYDPSGNCREEEVFMWGRYNGIFNIFLKERKAIILNTQKEGILNGAAVTLSLPRKKKTWIDKLKRIWNWYF